MNRGPLAPDQERYQTTPRSECWRALLESNQVLSLFRRALNHQTSSGPICTLGVTPTGTCSPLRRICKARTFSRRFLSGDSFRHCSRAWPPRALSVSELHCEVRGHLSHLRLLHNPFHLSPQAYFGATKKALQISLSAFFGFFVSRSYLHQLRLTRRRRGGIMHTGFLT